MLTERFAPVQTFSSIVSTRTDAAAQSVLGMSDAGPFPSAYIFAHDGTYSGLSLAQAKVSEFGTMNENWDGYGAEPIGVVTSGNAKLALNILSYMLPMPDITPNSNGTLSLEWETNAGLAHLEIGRTRCSMYVQRAANLPALYFSGSPNEINGNLGMLLYATLYAPLEHSKPVSEISGYGYAR